LPAVADDGSTAHRLGINLQSVQSSLRDAFAPSRNSGVAFINMPDSLAYKSDGANVNCFFVFIRQRLQQEGGRWVEVGVELKIFQIDTFREPQELPPSEAARMVRAFSTATRVRDPQKLVLPPDLMDIERDLYNRWRQPSDNEIQAGIRFAVWPLALIVAS
ncbi:MAG: hypothetical protein RL295_289, partial [Pseudomonadota bacterium]